MKTLVHWFSICFALSISLGFWATGGFRDFGAARELPIMPFILGTALFCVAFEPLLLSDFLEKRVRACSFFNLMVRGFVSGLAIFGVWAGLYAIGRRVAIDELVLIIAGYALAVGLGILGMVIGVGGQTVRATAAKPSS
jgi:hypothetical protein